MGREVVSIERLDECGNLGRGGSLKATDDFLTYAVEVTLSSEEAEEKVAHTVEILDKAGLLLHIGSACVFPLYDGNISTLEGPRTPTDKRVFYLKIPRPVTEAPRG